MNQTLRLLILFPLLFIGSLLLLKAQAPEQDCFNALPVCQNVYSQTNSYSGEGVLPNEISNGISCLGSGEKNSVWYIFTVQQAGNLCFTITPNVGGEDYDWAVYDLTNASCSDIATNASIEVSCNYAPNLGCGGLTGPNGNTTGTCGGQNEACIPVQVGETYVVNVSNFSSTTNGYTLDFSASTAVIFDNIPPEIDSLAVSCTGDISVFFSENVVCSTVQPTDFQVTDAAGNPYPVTGAAGGACLGGGTFENEFLLTFGAPLQPGQVIITLVDTVEDNCGNVGVIGTGDTAILDTTPVQLTATADSICIGDSVIITANFLPQHTYTWSGGVQIDDTTIKVGPQATTTYSTTATAPNGCNQSGFFTLVVKPTPTSTFDVATDVCADSVLTVTYTGMANPGAVFNWDFDGATILSGSGMGPYEVTWPAGGNYDISLWVIDNGCVSDTQAAVVQVPPKPIAEIVAPNRICLGELATIQAGAASVSPTATYSWEFDGAIVNSGAGAGPYQVEWFGPGIYDVCLIVEESGCVSLQTCVQVEVGLPPDAQITQVDDQCFDNNEFTFEYAGTSNIAVYDWDLGESSNTSSDASPTYSYQAFGDKTVELTVTDAFGCSNTSTIVIEVFPPVDAAFSFDEVCEGNPTPFSDLSQAQPGHEVTGWSWSLSDGGEYISSDPAHTFGREGTYTAKLVVTTVDGCSDSLMQSFQVYDQPQAEFTYDAICEDNITRLTNQSRFDDDDVTYSWVFPGGSGSNAENPQYTFTDAGNNQVSLRVTNADGCTDVFVDAVLVNGQPVPRIAADEVCEGTPMQLDGNTAGSGTDSVLMYEWIFPDGSTASGSNLTYEWEKAGRYQLKLITETQAGCRDSIQDSVYVWANPYAEFTFDEECLGETTAFSSTSGTAYRYGGQLVSHRWTYGDGASDVTPTAETSHEYTTPGVYLATLEVTTDKGCEAELTHPVEVYGIPDVPKMTGDTICAGDEAVLMGEVSSNEVDLSWYADNVTDQRFTWGGSYVTPNLIAPVTYFVSAVSEQGCESERVPVSVRVFPVMEGQLVISDTVLYMPDATAQLQVLGNFVGERYRWNFGDYNSSEEPAPVHTFEEAGRQLVTVEITSDAGCELILEQMVTVYQLAYLQIPSAFSPNGDGVNDIFYLDGHNMVGLEFTVFNRWGQIVYQTDDLGFQWRGETVQGGEVGSGTYAYRLRAYDAHGNTHDKAGTITVLR